MKTIMNTVRTAVISGSVIGLLSSLTCAYAAGPFDALTGQWSGSGKMNMSDGNSERIRCRSTYNASKDGHGFDLRLQCASDSYKIGAHASIRLNGDQLSGIWDESNYNLQGNVSGSAEGNTVDATLETSGIQMRLYIVTSGASQTVYIVPQQGLPIKSVHINNVTQMRCQRARDNRAFYCFTNSAKRFFTFSILGSTMI